MTDKELSRLRRTELLEMLIAQGKEYAKLQEQLKQTEKALHKRELTIQNAGTMADAAMQLNDVVGSTQRAVDLYIDNVRRVITQQQEESTEAVNQARNYASETVAHAEKRARLLLAAASEQASQLVSQARTEAERIVTQAREEAQQILMDAQYGKAGRTADARSEFAPASDAVTPSAQKRFFGLFGARESN